MGSESEAQSWALKVDFAPRNSNKALNLGRTSSKLWTSSVLGPHIDDQVTLEREWKDSVSHWFQFSCWLTNSVSLINHPALLQHVALCLLTLSRETKNQLGQSTLTFALSTQKAPQSPDGVVATNSRVEWRRFVPAEREKYISEGWEVNESTTETMKNPLSVLEFKLKAAVIKGKAAFCWRRLWRRSIMSHSALKHNGFRWRLLSLFVRIILL